jgi:hypothetical protein
MGTMSGDSANHLHQDLDPGLLEIGYEVTFGAKLRKRGLPVQRQVSRTFDELSDDVLRGC